MSIKTNKYGNLNVLTCFDMEYIDKYETEGGLLELSQDVGNFSERSSFPYVFSFI